MSHRKRRPRQAVHHVRGRQQHLPGHGDMVEELTRLLGDPVDSMFSWLMWDCPLPTHEGAMRLMSSRGTQQWSCPSCGRGDLVDFHKLMSWGQP